MSEPDAMPDGRLRPRRAREAEAVRTTIVGGRPPGSGKEVGDIPRGLEVLVKKAVVDPDFRALLLERRAGAASEIGLALEPAEAAMLNAVPAPQLEAIIARTTVSPITRAAFLGKAAAVMLAALGADVAVAGEVGTLGITPDRPPSHSTTRRERFILYSEINWRGEPSCGVLDSDAYEEKLAAGTRVNKALRPAYLAASKQWNQDEANKNTPFPMKMPQPLQCRKVETYTDRDRAEEMRKRAQEKLDKNAEEARQAEERRLAALPEDARAKEKQKAELLKAAEGVFERELRRILAAGLLRAIDLRRGFQTGGGEASEGIRPDRP
ncbi:MAG: hypothetical protein FJ290_02580 [Planctomycetes bacterium]|nr:hypothetical protein [Planctomycetota bacterium]